MNARPQEYEDYEQQTARPAVRNQQQPQQQQPKKLKDGETTTWIPIIQYDKSQAIDGSYKTQWDRRKWNVWIVLKCC